MERYAVTLTEGERAALDQRVSPGRGPARELTRARILLKADGGPAGPDGRWDRHGPGRRRANRQRVRRRFVEHGVDDAIRQHRPRRAYRARLAGEQEAHLIALACTPPPPGRRRWTLRLLADKLEIHYAPKHGSWLNIAEIELSTMAGQCLIRRIPDRETLEREVEALETERNALGGPVNWRFTTDDARV